MTTLKLRIESIRLQGIKRWCEDELFCNEVAGVYGVLDGATSITPWTDESGRTGAYLAAQHFADFFRRRESLLDLRQGVLDANTILRAAMESQGVDVEDKAELWCTCVAAVHIQNGEMTYAQLGDSMVVVIKRDSSVQVLTRDTVTGISRRAARQRDELRVRGIDIPEEDYASREAQLRYNRTLANLPNGYSVANGMPQVAQTIQFGRISLENVACILMVTDGLFWPVCQSDTSHLPKHSPFIHSEASDDEDTDGRCDWEKVASLVQQKGLIGYVNALIEWEQQTGRVPDDKAAVALWCEGNSVRD